MDQQTTEKRLAARAAANMVESGMVVGLGTGSTCAFMLERLGERQREEGLAIRGVSSSDATATRAAELGIPILPLTSDVRPDVYLDGADEVDPAGNLVKGGGGALLKEKLVLVWSHRRIIMVDSTKHVARLGSTFRIPVEVVRYGWTTTAARIADLGCVPELRSRQRSPFVTDEGHFILDCAFAAGIANPASVELALRSAPGVVETGLFLSLADQVVTGRGDRTTIDHFPTKPY